MSTPNTLFVGKVYLRFDELPSTNDRARDLLAAESPVAEGTVVRADSQPAGRGQFGSRWESEPGQNLTLSIIFRPAFLPLAEQFRLSQAVALAVRDTVEAALPPSLAPNLTLKWPNDLYLADRKMAGILIQNTLAGTRLQTAIVGIGLNVNQRVFRSDAPNPTSMAIAAERDFDLDALAGQLFKNLEIRYLQLKVAPASSALRTEYERHLYRRDVPVCFEKTTSGERFTGIIRGVECDGRLRIEHTSTGDALFFAVKEVRMARRF